MNSLRIEALEECVHILEATANHYYSAFEKKDEAGRTLLLKSRDKINKLLCKEYKQKVMKND